MGTHWIIRLCLALAAGLLLAGCASVKFGPEGGVSLTQAAKDGVVSDTPAPGLFQRATYYPGTLGFGSFSAGGDLVSGVLVITDKRVSFIKWDDERGKYRRIWALDRAAITEVVVEKFGAGRRAVIQVDAGFYTVTLGRDDSAFQDSAGTESLQGLLKP